MTYVSSIGSGWQCVALVPTGPGQTVTCILVDGMVVLARTHAPALTLVVQVDSNVDPGSLPVGHLVNTSSVTSPTLDPVTILTSADLSITKTHAGTVQVGPEAYPAVENTASVTSSAEDTKPKNNIASDPAAVPPLFNLEGSWESAAAGGFAYALLDRSRGDRLVE
jgi:hypothetical protein